MLKRVPGARHRRAVKVVRIFSESESRPEGVRKIAVESVTARPSLSTQTRLFCEIHVRRNGTTIRAANKNRSTSCSADHHYRGKKIRLETIPRTCKKGCSSQPDRAFHVQVDGPAMDKKTN